MSSNDVNYDCPYVENRKLETVAVVPYIRGFILTGPVANKRFVGSVRGVRAQILKETGRSALLGWFSVLGLLLNPLFILYGLFSALFVRRNLRKVREYLYDLSLPEDGPPDMVQVGYSLAASLIAADEIIDPQEISTAKEKGVRLFPDFDGSEFEKVVNNWRTLPDPRRMAGMMRSVLRPEQRKQIYDYLVEIAWADGSIQQEEEKVLLKVAKSLGLETTAQPAAG